MRSLIVLLVPAIVLAGCAAPADEALDQVQDLPVDVAEPELFLTEFVGHTMVGAADTLAHQLPFETYLWNAQQAGWLLELKEKPAAIEVRVDWEGEGAYRLHPHLYLGDDDQGVTQYYGYHSETFTGGTGCIRLNPEDMAAGIWPMMVHPASDMVMGDFTITVGVLGVQGEVLPEMHGHRADMNYVITDRDVFPCEYLADMDMGHSH